MRANKALAGLAGLGVACLVAVAWAGTTAKGAVKIGTVAWSNSLGDAERLATAQGKPILHLQMFGKLDDAFC